MEQFPNIWGNGGLFAFSGLDGPTSITEPFVLARTLTFGEGLRLDDARLVACDCADLDLHLALFQLSGVLYLPRPG